MKNLFLATVFISFAQIAYAASPPLGKFDCSLQRGQFVVEVSRPNGGFYYAKVEHVIDAEETKIEGPLLVAQQKSSNGKSFQRIRLPGSNVEFYFDEDGKIGLSRDHLNCKRM